MLGDTLPRIGLRSSQENAGTVLHTFNQGSGSRRSCRVSGFQAEAYATSCAKPMSVDYRFRSPGVVFYMAGVLGGKLESVPQVGTCVGTPVCVTGLQRAPRAPALVNRLASSAAA